MNLGDFRKATKDFPDNMELVLQGDSEGNYYQDMRGVDNNCIWDEDCETVLTTTWSAGDCCMEEEDWETLKEEKDRILVLFP